MPSWNSIELNYGINDEQNAPTQSDPSIVSRWNVDLNMGRKCARHSHDRILSNVDSEIVRS